MAERVVRVRLAAAVADFDKSMKQAANATAAVGTEAEKLAQKKQAFQQMGTAGLAMGTLLSAGLVVAAKAATDFDAQMSSVQAATHETAANMDLLRQAALDAGESTVFSATESAAAIEELAKAGVSTADILDGGLTGALDLAAAGGLDVASAAGIAATALKQFNLNGSDMAHVADLLSAGAGKAMGDVDDLAQALNQSALVAKQTGLSIEETTAGLAAFAEQGLLGSDAGTSFKTMLQSLNPTSAEAARLMEEYGLSAYDAQGNFIGLAEYAGRLKDGLSGLSVEQQNATLKTIFGSDAVRAATVLYQQGEEGIEKWTDAVNDQGYAAETARTRLDNLKGDIEALGGAFETALIDTGSTANDMLRGMVQAVTGLVGIYNDLPQPVQATVMALGGAAAAVTLSGGAAFTAIPKWMEFKAIVEASKFSMTGIGLAAGGAGLALGGLFLIIGELAASQQRAQQRAQAYADTLEDGTNKVTQATKDLAKENLSARSSFLWWEDSSVLEKADQLGISLGTVQEAVYGNAEAMRELQKVQQEYDDAVTRDRNAGDFNREDDDRLKSINAIIDAVKGEADSLDDAIDMAELKQEADADSSTSAKTVAEAYTEQADAVADLNSTLTDLIDKINSANDVAGDAITTNANYLAALDGISEQAQKAGTSLDENTVAGSANAAALNEVADKARAAAEAQFLQDRATMSAEEATQKWNGTLGAQRQAFVDSAVAAGYNRDEVNKLADRIFQMPDAKYIDMLVETADAQGKIDKFINLNNGKRVKIYVDTEGNESFKVGSKTVSAPGMSSGGPVFGPGPRGRDSELRMLAPGEHVLTAQEVDAAGGHSAVEEFRQAMLAGPVSPYVAYAEPQRHGNWVSGADSTYRSAPAPVSVSFPESVTLVDADGSILSRARVVADDQIIKAQAATFAPFSGGRR